MSRSFSIKVAAIALLLVGGLQAPVLAKDQSPIDVVRDQIATLFNRTDNLQSQINTIQLTPGPQGLPGINGTSGAPGIQGPKGDAGAGLDASKIYKVFNTVSVPAGATYSGQAVCRDNNDIVINGGFTLGSDAMNIMGSESNPGSPGTAAAGWVASASNKGLQTSFFVINASCIAID